MRRVLLTLTLFTLTIGVSAQNVRQNVPASAPPSAQTALPNKAGTVKFAVLGDTGTGSSDQRRVADQLSAYRAKFPFEFVLLLGDNMYGSDKPSDYVKKFEQPYKAVLDAGIKFYAVLGNHDDPNQRLYKPFNMNGERFYTYKPSPNANVRFFMLDSNYMSPEQLQWLEKQLAASGSEWKIALFHHPLYASGMHGSDEVLRAKLEPLFLKYGVNVVLTGHEHFYERIKPQKGIQYFVQGSSAKLRSGDISARTGLTEVGYDSGYTFMLVEIDGDTMHFQVVNQQGMSVDRGTVLKAANSNAVIGTSGARGSGTRGTAPVQPAPAGRGRTTTTGR